MKCKLFFGLLFLLSLVQYTYPKSVTAWKQTGCTFTFTDRLGKIAPPFTKDPNPDLDSVVNWKIHNLNPNNEYTLEASCTTWHPCWDRKTGKPDGEGIFSWTFTFTSLVTDNNIELRLSGPDFAQNPGCIYTIEPSDWKAEEPTPTPTPSQRADCTITVEPPTGIYLNEDDSLKVIGSVTNIIGLDKNTTKILQYVGPDDYGGYQEILPVTIEGNGKKQGFPYLTIDNKYFYFESDIKKWSKGNYEARADILLQDSSLKQALAKCSIIFDVCVTGVNSCQVIIPSPTPTDSPGCWVPNGPCQKTTNPCDYPQCYSCSFCKGLVPPEPVPSLAAICERLADEFKPGCKICMDREHGIWTAIGCFPTDLGRIITEKFFGVGGAGGIGLGIAGAITFLYFLYGAFIFLTSRGNPERVAMGKEIIVSSLMGLLLIVFSIFLFKIIAEDILQIPGFNK